MNSADKRKIVPQGSRAWALTATFISEGASGLLPLMIVPVLVSRLGAEAYGLTLVPLALAALLVSALDLGLALGMPVLWVRQRSSSLRVLYVVATIQIKLVTALVAVLMFYAAWWVVAPAATGMSWVGGYLMMVGQLLYPNWIFIVTGRVIEGQLLNACGRLIPIMLLFLVLRPGDSPGMVNALLALGSLTVTLIAYVMMLPRVGSPTCFTLGALGNAWRIAGPLAWRQSRLWMAQLAQSAYRTSLPVIAAAFLAPTAFLAYSVSEKCLRACQLVQANVLQFDFSRLIRTGLQGSIKQRLLDYVVTHVLTTAIGLSAVFYVGFQWLAPLIFAGNSQVMEIALDLNPLLSALVVVGALNFWLGALGLPVVNRRAGLLTASAAAGVAALVSAALASQQGNAKAFLLAMCCGELTFLVIVLGLYRKRSENFR